MTQFASAPYLLFVAVVCVVYYALPGSRSRSAWLFTTGIGFVWSLSPTWAMLLVSTILVTYASALAIGRAHSDRDRRRGTLIANGVFVAALALALGSLVAFKYLALLAGLGNRLLNIASAPSLLPMVEIALPVGISFWTFQAVAYLVDVRRGLTEPVRSLVHYASAVAFLPILTAGPITRIQELVPRLEQRHRFDYAGMQSGLLLMARGFFKKLMVADYLAVFVESVFASPRRFGGLTSGMIFSVAAVAFAFQLYCDFSGYTDIVRGSARLFGIQLPNNFAAPYFARSVKDFWRRWHITLMDWLRDYVYIPLGGNRKGRWRRYANLMVVFLVSGLWHGAGVHFIAWGALNGAYQVVSELTGPVRSRVAQWLRIDTTAFSHKLFQTTITFLLITVAWVFFRAASTSDAIYMVSRMFIPTIWIFVDGTIFDQGLSAIDLGIAGLSLVAVLVADWTTLTSQPLDWLNRQHVTFRWSVYLLLIATVAVFGRYGGSYTSADFIYYRF